MAFDHNSVPKDLRPLNIAGIMPEETRIAPATTSGRNIEGFYVTPSLDVGSHESVPVFYPATMSDAGFVGAGYSNVAPGVGAWCPRMPTTVTAAAPGVNSTTGHSYNPSFDTRIGCNASDEGHGGGGDFTSGRKIKFMCSFGGKILPRPSDGMLRYVGGQTRIVSVRRDVSFNELVQKMVDTYGQSVVIKYQLPGEDLDALVSVSCPDDLENMMDEYEKLVERSLDGSAKLRVFLFSSSELDSSGMVHFGELPDSGQKYVQAVNGIMDGVGSGGITRKESIASATSTQNSDLSGTEAIDNSGHDQVNLTGPLYTAILSPRGNYVTTPQESAVKLVNVDPSYPIYSEVATTSPGTPMFLPGPQIVTSQLEHDIERSMPVSGQLQQVGVELHQPEFNIQPRGPHLQPYVDPHQETLNCADYVQIPSQMVSPTQLLQTVGPAFAHNTQFHDNAPSVASHQFIPPTYMTMTPSPSHGSMRPNVVLPLVRSQQIQLERYPEEGTFGARVVQLPGGQNFNAHQAQVPPPMVGGGYGWHQIPRPEQVVFPEGLIPHQQVRVLRFKDCYMCEKALPHAHSDTVVQDPREISANVLSDLDSAYHSLRLDDKMITHSMNRVEVNGALGRGEGAVEQHGDGARERIFSYVDHETGKPQSDVAGATQNVDRQYESDAVISLKADILDHRKVPLPQGVVGLDVPTLYQVKQETLMNKPVNSDVHPGAGMAFHMPDHMVYDSPKDRSGKLPGIATTEYSVESYNHQRQIDGRMENLLICPSDVLVNNEQSTSPIDNTRKEDVLDNRQQLIDGKEFCLENNTFSTPRIVLNTNHIKPNEMLPSSNEVPLLHNPRSTDSYEMAQPPVLSNNPTSYQQSKPGINHLVPGESCYGNSAFPGVDSCSVRLTERIPPIGECTANPLRSQPKVLPGDVEMVASNGNTPSFFSVSNRVGDIQDNLNSLFSNQDPWDLHHDTQFPPPRPTKIAIRKEGFGPRGLFGKNHLDKTGELPMGKSGELTAEVQLEDGAYQSAANMSSDLGSEHNQATQAEELIKQELQDVAEGVAASVLQSSMPSHPDITRHERSEILFEAYQDGEVQNTDVEMHKAEFEDIKTKLPEKTNLGFRVSNEIGRLQIIKNSDLEELQELGSGTFGTVYHGKWRGTDVAIKRINDRCFAGKPSEQERMREDFWNEAIKLADLHHPNVVAFYGVVLDGPGGSVATVTEYMVNGSLRNALQKNERNLDKRKRLLIAMDVAFGMEYLHGKNIVHFDLKSDNLLVNLRDPHRPICKVGDLGLSKVKCQTLISGGVRGTLPWMAPELLNGSSSLVSEKVDVFSFAIVMWELLTGEEPYADLHYGAIIGGIVNNTLRPPVPESCEPEWRSLMEKCWSSEPSERPSFTKTANELRAMAAKFPQKAQAQ